MGKRSDFERKPRDYYQTPFEAVKPLIPHLPASFTFCEPCAGDGRLITHIETLHDNCECIEAFDIEPQADDIEEQDVLDTETTIADLFITNPPWIRTKASGFLLHAIIEKLSDIAPTWLLFDGDWLHTIQASELIKSRLVKVVSIGRVKWIENSASTGKDNCVWYLFDKNKTGQTEFVGR